MQAANLNLLRYQAGSARRFEHEMRFSFWDAKFSLVKSDVIAGAFEFWCQRNCKFGWRLEEYTRDLIISFEHPRDFVLFKISEEYSVF